MRSSAGTDIIKKGSMAVDTDFNDPFGNKYHNEKDSNGNGMVSILIENLNLTQNFMDIGYTGRKRYSS